MLDKQGIILAIAMGAIIAVFGGLNYLILMLVFFVLAVGVTKYQHSKKRELGIYEHERSWENVLSNGIVPTVLAVVSPYFGPLPFICSISATTADKFASELGVLSGQPIDLGTLKHAKPGVSGAVSVLGTFVSLTGGILVGVSSMFLFDVNANTALIIGLAGLFGSIVDSIFGIFEEKGIGTKSTTNIICSLAGAAVGFLLR